MNVVEWITETTACGVCLRPTAPPDERVICIDVSPQIGSCVVCERCFFAMDPPRREMTQQIVLDTILIVSTHPAPRGRAAR